MKKTKYKKLLPELEKILLMLMQNFDGKEEK